MKPHTGYQSIRCAPCGTLELRHRTPHGQISRSRLQLRTDVFHRLVIRGPIIIVRYPVQIALIHLVAHQYSRTAVHQDMVISIATQKMDVTRIIATVGRGHVLTFVHPRQHDIGFADNLVHVAPDVHPPQVIGSDISQSEGRTPEYVRTHHGKNVISGRNARGILMTENLTLVRQLGGRAPQISLEITFVTKHGIVFQRIIEIFIHIQVITRERHTHDCQEYASCQYMIEFHFHCILFRS